MMKLMPFLLFLLIVSLMAACAGQDRTDEKPRAPQNVRIEAAVSGTTCILTGSVGESHNSSLLGCGFIWGNGTASHSLAVDEPDMTFQSQIDTLSLGTYFAIAYAANGIGRTESDTIYFTVE